MSIEKILFKDTYEFKKALELLKSGEVIGLPTETVYGLAGDITQPAAVQKIFKVKNRPFFDPLIVHIAEINQVHSVVAEWPVLAQKLAEKFWPGPLTLVLPKHKSVNSLITSGLDSVAVRMPSHEMARELIRALGQPVAAPSANKFGQTSPSDAQHVVNEFDQQIFVLDGGTCTVGVESTVVGFDNQYSEIKIFRPGAVTQEMLSAFAPTKRAQSGVSPGHLEHHYMPKIPLVIVKSPLDFNADTYEPLRQSLKVNVLYPSWMTLPNDPVLAARSLYSQMRLAAERFSHANLILLAFDFSSRNHDLWAAVSDRLQKAASRKCDENRTFV